MQSSEAADENQRRVEGVFAELAATEPSDVSYLVFRLADDSFVHVSFHDHRDDDPNGRTFYYRESCSNDFGESAQSAFLKVLVP